MEVRTVGALAASDGVLVVVRRVAVVVGLLFGLGVVALIVADRAAAEEHGGSAPAGVAARNVDAPAVGGPGRLTESLTRPVADVMKPVADTVQPIAEPVGDPVEPVVAAVAEAVAPVTGPVLRPVVGTVTGVVEPVLDVAAPVTGSLLSPVLDAAKPVVAPVAGMTGLTDAVSGARSQGSPVPVEALAVPAEPVVPVVSSSPAVVPVASPSQPVAGVVPSATASGVTAAVVRAGPDMAPGWPGPRPVPPGSPVPFAVTGGGVAVGTGGAHGGDTAMAGGSDGLAGPWARSGRAPPGTIAGIAWLGHDDRDHPS